MTKAPLTPAFNVETKILWVFCLWLASLRANIECGGTGGGREIHCYMPRIPRTLKGSTRVARVNFLFPVLAASREVMRVWHKAGTVVSFRSKWPTRHQSRTA